MSRKIVIACSTYYPEVNGVQFVTQSLAEGLVKKGYEVTVICENKPDRENRESINGVHIVRCEMHNFHMWHYGNKKEFQRMILELSADAKTVICVNLQSNGADWALPILDKIKCQKILYQHGIHSFQIEKIDTQSAKNMMIKLLRNIRWKEFYTRNKKRFKKFDKVIHLHEKDYSYQYFERLCPGKNYVLENFAEDMFFEHQGEFDRIKSKYGIADGRYIIYVSNYNPGKNQSLLLEAFRELDEDINLIMIGSSENAYYDKLKKFAETSNGGRKRKKQIYLLTHVERREIAAFLQNAVMAVMTSKQEKFPIVITECMAAGIPYLSTDVGIVRYLPGGLIVKTDKDSINAAVAKMLHDEQLYTEKKREAVEYAQEQLNYGKYLEHFINILDK